MSPTYSWGKAGPLLSSGLRQEAWEIALHGVIEHPVYLKCGTVVWCGTAYSNQYNNVTYRRCFYCSIFVVFPIPFQCCSLGNAYRTAWGPKSPDQIGLVWPVPSRENTGPYSCGPIGETLFAPLLIWACKLLWKTGSSHSPPPTCWYSLWHHRAVTKIGCGTRIHTAFGALRLHWTKKFIKSIRNSLDIAFL